MSKHGGISLLHFSWSRLRRTLSVILPCAARTFLIIDLSVLITRLFTLLIPYYYIVFSSFVNSYFRIPPILPVPPGLSASHPCFNLLKCSDYPQNTRIFATLKAIFCKHIIFRIFFGAFLFLSFPPVKLCFFPPVLPLFEI